MIVAGLGFRSTCTADEIVSLVMAVSAAARAEVAFLAVPSTKASAQALLIASKRLALRISPVDQDRLIAVQPRCPSRSDAAMAALGVGSVAEACALAGAGPGAELLIAKTSNGAATCALALSSGASDR